jgi:hypothetical protein
MGENVAEAVGGVGQAESPSEARLRVHIDEMDTESSPCEQDR